MKNIFVLLFLLSGGIIYGQVSINTLNPLSGALHIDSSGDNGTGTPTSTQTVDDVFISNSGYVGIGHTAPQAQFHVKTNDRYNGSIKIEDGTQFNARILKSDASGKAFWDYAGEIQVVYGVLGSGVNLQLSTATPYPAFHATEGYVDLSPGTWLITCSMLLHMETSQAKELSQRWWIRSSFSDTEQGGYSSDILMSTKASGLAYTIGNGQLNGFIIIKNGTTSTKRYYYVTDFCTRITAPTDCILTDFAKGGVVGNEIIAYKMKDN